MEGWGVSTRILTLVLVAAAAACGEGERAGSSSESMSSEDMRASSPSPADEHGLLCDRIDDDEALTPPGAEPLDMPDITGLSGERRCMVVFGVDMPHDELRQFHRSALGDLGYEIGDWVEGEGIVSGNLGRTFVRATKPGLHANLTIDEFDPEETPLSDHRIQARMQFDVTGE
jgi:hypothetical protein